MISRSMTLQTTRGGMRAGQRKLGHVVVKNQVCIAGRVTGQAGRAFVHVSIYIIVFLVCFGVLVAYRAAEYRKIGWIGMAIHALIPFTLVLTAVNGEVIGIVLRKRSGHPAWVGGVAGGTIGGEVCVYVVWVKGACVIRLVAGRTIGRRIRIRS